MPITLRGLIVYTESAANVFLFLQTFPTFQELIAGVQQIGLPSIAFLMGMFVGIRVLNSGLSDHEQIRKTLEKTLEANGKLLEKNSVLETELRLCKEQYGNESKNLAVLEQVNQRAVDKFLDDTQDFYTELQFVVEQNKLLEMANKLLTERLERYEKASENPNLGQL